MGIELQISSSKRNGKLFTVQLVTWQKKVTCIRAWNMEFSLRNATTFQFGDFYKAVLSGVKEKEHALKWQWRLEPEDLRKQRIVKPKKRNKVKKGLKYALKLPAKVMKPQLFVIQNDPKIRMYVWTITATENKCPLSLKPEESKQQQNIISIKTQSSWLLTLKVWVKAIKKNPRPR